MNRFSVGRRGFTLLETLISIGLIGLLMAVTWSLLSMYTRVEQQGNERALALQLVRSLHNQLRRDLQAIVTTSPANIPQSPVRPASAPQFVGTTESMQFLTLAEPLLARPGLLASGLARPGLTESGTDSPALSAPQGSDSVPPVDGDFAPRSSPRTAGQFAPEAPEGEATQSGGPQSHLARARDVGFRTVEYRFYPHAYLALAPRDTLNRPPLEAPVAFSATSQGLVRSANPWPNGAAGPPTNTFGSRAIQPQVFLADTIPEVTRCEFRYFDGTTWRVNWQGRAEQPLPAAIEIAFDLATYGAHQAMLANQFAQPNMVSPLPGSPLPGSPIPASALPGSALPGSALPGSALPGVNEPTSELDDVLWVPQYRFVIRLNQAFSAPGDAPGDDPGDLSWDSGDRASPRAPADSGASQESLP